MANAKQFLVQDKLIVLEPELIETTYAELKSLRDSGQLQAGKQYRITDYVTTTTQENTRSAGHRFDVIVTADDEKTLNEKARAIQHEGDTYFANSNLSSWELWYKLDNNTENYFWADEINGKGVIYRMIDEFNNDLPYDFKNIQYLGSTLTSYETFGLGAEEYYYTFSNIVSQYQYNQWGSNYNVLRNTTLDTTINGVKYYGFTCNATPSAWSEPNFLSTDSVLTNSSSMYELDGSTISYGGTLIVNDEFGILDNSLKNSNYNNKINAFVSTSDGVNFKFYLLYSCFVGNNFRDNTIGNNFRDNTIGNNFRENTIGNYFYNNTIGNYFYNNTIGNYFYNNTIGNYFYNNTIGNYFYNNTIGESFGSNTIGNDFYNNTIGNDFYNNTIGESFGSNTIGESFGSNTIGESNGNNYINSNVMFSSFGNGCKNIYMFYRYADGRIPLIAPEYAHNYIIENGVEYIQISDNTTSDSTGMPSQNIKICSGVMGYSTANLKTIILEQNKAYQQVFKASGSTETEVEI